MVSVSGEDSLRRDGGSPISVSRTTRLKLTRRDLPDFGLAGITSLDLVARRTMPNNIS